jgi:DNA-binding GntR family transcriptional regulator
MKQEDPLVVIQSVAEQVRDLLGRAIIEGTLQPNAVLSDRQLSEQFGASRTPIREAFHQLEAAGLVRRRNRVGWIVADLKRRDVEEIIELRSILEATGVRKVLQLPEAELAPFATYFDAFATPFDSDSLATYLASDRGFHGALVEATANRRIIDLYQVVEWQIDRIRHLVSYRMHQRVDQSLVEHRRICDALASRDAEAAIGALNDHLANVEKKFIELLETRTCRPGDRHRV